MSDNQTDARKIEVVEVHALMSNESGRHTMYRVLEFSGIDHDTFNKDSHEHARNAGRREVGLWLRDELKDACFDKYLMMLKENIDG
jgi:hypothetical protein